MTTIKKTKLKINKKVYFIPGNRDKPHDDLGRPSGEAPDVC